MNVLITGGASGLGEAITRKLAADDSSFVYFTYSSSKDTALSIESKYKNTKAIYCDFKNQASFDSFLASVATIDVDVLINNAFTGFTKNHFHKLSSEYFLESFKHNVIPTIQLTQKIILGFRKRKFGKIITILSAAIINKPPIGWSEYVANKNYLLSLSKSWAIENSSFNITSNCISPSFMQTALNKDTDERIVDEMTNSHPLKRLLTIDEVGESVEWLMKSSQQINGVNLVINGGADLI
jgi:3-oxoacyl-[acyl-carrier protein] reductase